MIRTSIGNEQQMLRTRWPRSILSMFGVLALTLAVVQATAQTSTGGIVGQVEDAQSAIIPGATVTITSGANGQTFVVKTDGSGLYSVTALPPGMYTVTVAKTGFSDLMVNAVSVNIASTSTVNAKMKVGSAATTVDVNAEGQMLDQTSPTISTAVPNEISSNMPLPERSAMEAVMLAPGVQGDPQYDMGVQSENTQIYTQPTTPGGSLAVGGGRPGSAMQLVDGVDLTMIGYPRAGLTFSGDDLQQITVQSGAISAKYGRSGGGVINQASHAGTLQYHGVIAFRHEDPFFEATTFGAGTLNFNSSSGTISRPVTQDVHQNMFTALLDGPVPIRWHHIDQKTFFFASYEPLRAGSKVWSRTRVPTPAELSGDFSNSYTLLNTSILSSQGYAAAVAAPRVGGLDYQFPLNSNGFPDGARYNSAGQYVPIPNYNLSAQLAQNSCAKFVLSQFPQPTSGGGSTPYLNFLSSDASDGNNALVARGVENTDNRYNIRLDQNLGTSDHAFFRYTDIPVSGIRFSLFPPNSALNSQPESVVDSVNTMVDYTHVVRSSAVNDVQYAYTRMNYLVLPAPSGLTTDFAAKYGLTPSVEGVGFPTISIDTGGYGSSTGGNDGGRSVNAIYQLGDDFSLVVGRHSLSFGGEWRAMQLDRLPDAGIYGGSYSFSAGNTNDGSSGGNATASFILGSINGLTLSAAQEFYYRYKYFGAYVMDNWKVTHKLTLDLGMRYNLEFPRTEKYGLQGSFLPNVAGTLNGVAATGAFAFSGHNGLPNTFYPVNYKGFEPRLGFAYLVTPKMTLRGSAELMHTPMTDISNSNIPALTPNSLTIGGVNGGTEIRQNGSTTSPIRWPFRALEFRVF